MRTVRHLLACALAAGGAAAQSTWVVDANNGPGTSFTTLPAAVAAAAPGDILLVRSAVYTEGFSTSKGLTILGQPDFLVLAGSSSTDVVTVKNLPVGETFVLTGCQILYGAKAAFAIDNAAGRVHLQDVAAAGNPSANTPLEAALRVTSSRTVTVTGGSFDGAPGVLASGSDVVLSGATIRGASSFSLHFLLTTASAPGLVADHSTVALSRCGVTGGSGTFSPFSTVVYPGQPAVDSTESALTVTGLAGQVLTAGSDPNSLPVPGILTSGGTLRLDTQLVVQGQNGGPAVGGSAVVVQRRIVSFLASGGELGASVTAEVGSPQGDLVAVFVGAPIPPASSPFGPVFVDLSRAVALVYLAVQPPSEIVQTGFAVPALPALRGAALALQAVNFYQANPSLEMSNPSVVCVR